MKDSPSWKKDNVSRLAFRTQDTGLDLPARCLAGRVFHRLPDIRVPRPGIDDAFEHPPAMVVTKADRQQLPAPWWGDLLRTPDRDRFHAQNVAFTEPPGEDQRLLVCADKLHR